MHTKKNQVHRNTRHDYSDRLRPVAAIKEVKEEPAYYYCSRATIVEASDNHMKAYCSR